MDVKGVSAFIFYSITCQIIDFIIQITKHRVERSGEVQNTRDQLKQDIKITINISININVVIIVVTFYHNFLIIMMDTNKCRWECISYWSYNICHCYHRCCRASIFRSSLLFLSLVTLTIWLSSDYVNLIY